MVFSRFVFSAALRVLIIRTAFAPYSVPPPPETNLCFLKIVYTTLQLLLPQFGSTLEMSAFALMKPVYFSTRLRTDVLCHGPRFHFYERSPYGIHS